MRRSIFALYTYVIILAFSMKSFLWNNWLCALLFIVMYCYSLYLIEKLRCSDPGTYTLDITRIKVDSEEKEDSRVIEASSSVITIGLKQRNQVHADVKLDISEVYIISIF
jgi:hypothetical protein